MYRLSYPNLVLIRVPGVDFIKVGRTAQIIGIDSSIKVERTAQITLYASKKLLKSWT